MVGRAALRKDMARAVGVEEGAWPGSERLRLGLALPAYRECPPRQAMGTEAPATGSGRGKKQWHSSDATVRNTRGGPRAA